MRMFPVWMPRGVNGCCWWQVITSTWVGIRMDEAVVEYQMGEDVGYDAADRRRIKPIFTNRFDIVDSDACRQAVTQAGLHLKKSGPTLHELHDKESLCRQVPMNSRYGNVSPVSQIAGNTFCRTTF